MHGIFCAVESAVGNVSADGDEYDDGDDDDVGGRLRVCESPNV